MVRTASAAGVGVVWVTVGVGVVGGVYVGGLSGVVVWVGVVGVVVCIGVVGVGVGVVTLLCVVAMYTPTTATMIIAAAIAIAAVLVRALSSFI